MGFLGGLGAAAQIGGDLFGLFGNKPEALTEGQKALEELTKSAIPAGEEALGRGKAYDLALLSGNPAAQAAAIAPQVNAASEQATAERNRIASEGTGRGGGVNAIFQQAADLPAKTSVDALTTLQPEAAKHLESAGLSEAGMGEHAASSLTSSGLEERGQKQDFLSNILNKMKLPTGTGTSPAPGGTPSAGSPLSDIQTPAITGSIPDPASPELAGGANPNELDTLFPYGSFGNTPA